VNLIVAAGGVRLRLGQVVQSMAKDAGFDVHVQPLEYVSALTQAKAGKFDTFLTAWSGRIDPDGNTTGLLTSGGPNNYGGLRDPAIDKAIKQAAATNDTATRQQFYTQVIDREHQLRTVIYLCHEIYFLGLTKNIAGVRFYADGLLRLSTAGYVR
jgi:peptide/nickel transport system substrate-binding protein